MEPDTEIFQLDIDAAELESAPVFDFDNWDYPLEEDWDSDYQSYWESL